jgi:mannosyltransferase OCH1-like enzyme
MKIHQIWIGSKKRPDIWMNTVKDFATSYGHEYVLWDDKKVSELSIINKEYLDKQKEFCGKADILRYEILSQFGGLYIDADIVIVNRERMNTLIKEFNTDCAFGFEIDNKLICNAIMFAVQKSKFIQKCIEEIPKRDMTQLAWLSVGPKLITDLYAIHRNDIALTVHSSVVFYPIQWHGIADINIHTQYCFLPETATFQYGYSTNTLESYIGTN